MCFGDRPPRDALLPALAAMLLLVVVSIPAAAVTCPSGPSAVFNLTSCDLYDAIIGTGAPGPGNTYQLAPGTYTMSYQIWLQSSSTTTCIIGSSPNDVLITLGNISPFMVGVPASTTVSGAVLGLQGLTLAGSFASGVSVESGGSVDINNVVLQRFYMPLRAQGGAEDVRLTSVAFRYNTGHACDLMVGAKSFAWHEVEFSHNTGKAIVVSGSLGATSLSISGRALFNYNAEGAIWGLGEVHFTFTGEAEFLGNSGESVGGAALYLVGASATFTENLTIKNNTAFGSDGGAIAMSKGATLVASGPTFLLDNHALANPLDPTTHVSGGALYMSTSDAAKYDTIASFTGLLVVQGNTAQGSGGAFYLTGPVNGSHISRVSIAAESVFKNNTAASSTAPVVGGAVALMEGAIFHVTNSGSICMQGNSAALSGGGIFSAGQILLNSTSSNMANNSPDDILIATPGFVECPRTERVLSVGSYYITGPVCSCASVSWPVNRTSTCGCPEGYLWEAAHCSCKAYNLCGNVNGTSIPYQCMRGVFNSSTALLANPSDSVCCQPTCGDSIISSPTPVHYNCTGPWQFNLLSVNVTVLITESCCRPNRCGNVNGTGIPFQCTGNWLPNPAAAGNAELSPNSCCLWAATCQTGYIESNRVCERGVYNPAANSQLNPSLYTCCQDSCGDSNIMSSPARPWQCTRGAYDRSKARSAKPSNSVCCQPTCGDSNLSSPSPIHYPCTGQWQFNPMSANMTVLSNLSCCTLQRPKLALSVQLTTSAPVKIVGDSVDFAITAAAAGPTEGAVAPSTLEVAVAVAIPNGLSVVTASLPAGEHKSVVLSVAASKAGNYTIEATASSPSMTDPSNVTATAGINVQGACCNSITGLCQATATAAECVAGSFLQDRSCAMAACPAPTGPANVTISRTSSVDAKDIAVGNVVDVELVVGASNAASKAFRAQVTVTGRVVFTGKATVGTQAAGCNIETLTPKSKKTGITQRLSCILGSMQHGQTKSIKYSFMVLEAGAATIRSRVASASSTNQDVLTFTSLGACCLSSSTTESPSCRDMTLAACKAAGGKLNTKQTCTPPGRSAHLQAAC